MLDSVWCQMVPDMVLDGCQKKLVPVGERCRMQAQVQNASVGVSVSKILSFLLPTTAECRIVSGAGWCQMVLDMMLDGCQKKLVLDRCQMEKGAGCEREQDFKFFAPYHY